MSDESSSNQNLATEYSVIGSYTTAMTGARFQTVAIYLAAIGLVVSRGSPSRLAAMLILVVSAGLWLLDLRNRDVLWRLGERGRYIEEFWGNQPRPNATTGGAGFFLDSTVPPRLRFLSTGPIRIPPAAYWVVSHAFGIDTIFLGVIGYAIALLFQGQHRVSLLVVFVPLLLGIVVASVVERRVVRASGGSTDDAG